MGSLSTEGWSNRIGTAELDCVCGSWRQHWVNHSGESWPSQCSVLGCTNPATVGAHIVQPAVTGVRIAALCDACNKRSGTFTLKDGTRLAQSNVAATCGKPKPQQVAQAPAGKKMTYDDLLKKLGKK